MKQLYVIFIILTLTKVLNAQVPNGLYFENIVGTEWVGERIINNYGFFTYKDFSLSLIKNSNHIEKDTLNYWVFDTTNVFLISNQDTLFQLNYKIDKLNKSIVFKNKNDSISCQYVSVSTGNFIRFTVNNNIKIVGITENSKDGAIIRSKGVVYRINNKDEWTTNLLGKKVKVNAKIISNEFTTETDLGYDNKEFKQGRLGRTITVSLKEKIKIIGDVLPSNDIIGDWGIYVTKYNGVSTMCNVCPRIVFKTDNFAKIKFVNGEYEEYHWKIDGDNIIVKPERKDTDNYLIDNTYKMEFKQKDDFIELTLKLNEIEYILRK